MMYLLRLYGAIERYLNMFLITHHYSKYEFSFFDVALTKYFTLNSWETNSFVALFFPCASHILNLAMNGPWSEKYHWDDKGHHKFFLGRALLNGTRFPICLYIEKHSGRQSIRTEYADFIYEATPFYPAVAEAIKIGLTLPATICNIELLFSTLQHVKTWNWSTIRDERLNKLCMLKVHRKRIQENTAEFIGKVTNKYKQQPRRLKVSIADYENEACNIKEPYRSTQGKDVRERNTSRLISKVELSSWSLLRFLFYGQLLLIVC
ncbi:hypothetical protein Anas_09637 [Armadillidium nasatum]|uniref:HAT C-terminal dimerisation domain-containing protein n=1 Tax=Armadillidium nasatum TaxID=96803 RepID=A0A5N5SNU0_9CRUS|nr:hypothetical protein Anas_09637 [Armadillidium nasatum]